MRIEGNRWMPPQEGIEPVQPVEGVKPTHNNRRPRQQEVVDQIQRGQDTVELQTQESSVENPFARILRRIRGEK